MDGYVYQYLIGGTVFGIGVLYAARQGYLGFSGKALRNLVILFAGLAFFMLLQGYMQYGDMQTANSRPYTGEGLEGGRIGTTLDYGVVVVYFIAILAIGTPISNMKFSANMSLEVAPMATARPMSEKNNRSSGVRTSSSISCCRLSREKQSAPLLMLTAPGSVPSRKATSSRASMSRRPPRRAVRGGSLSTFQACNPSSSMVATAT